ncbi:MFS transporter [Frondihabitans australicus]|uniref:MFS transporter n=1 Tax=Frondihabitans australicus TaxID=386892 RepID=A0A495IF97_9MICO|nr:MFS transporter [Frondihabitans australicus]
MAGGAGGACQAGGVTRTDDPRGFLRVAPAVAALAWGGNHFIPLMLMYRSIDGYDQVQVDLFLAVYVIGLVPGFLLAGTWSDRWGRRRIMLAGLPIGIAGSVILALGSSTIAGMCAGRFLSGVSVAVAMVVGSSWIKELSEASGQGQAGARRASITLSLGFGGGAGVAGVLAQWGPWPTILPYAVQIAATLVGLVVVLGAAETRQPDPSITAIIGDVRIRPAIRGVFLRRVLPIAPWIFGASALAFAVGPSLVTARTGHLDVAFATLATVITLGVGTSVQLAFAAIDRALHGRSGTVGVALAGIGAVILVAAALDSSIAAVLVAAPIFGAGYGLCMVAGLSAVQAMADGNDLAGLTAIFYSVSYAGFFLPMILAALAPVVGYLAAFVGVAVLCGVCAWVPLRRVSRAA